MAASPGLKVFNPSGEYVASCKFAEDAAAIVAIYGDGAEIRIGHKKTDCVWREGSEVQPAGESFDQVALTVCRRAKERADALRARGRGTRTVGL
jgi:hypothetical protein